MLIDDLDSIPEMFKDGIRGVLLLHRNKDGAKGNAQRKAIKMISTGIEDWKNIVLEFRELQKNVYQNYRIYSSINSRDMEKAIREFKTRQLNNDYSCDIFRDHFYSDIQNSFFSCLMWPNSRSQNNFLIDCDTDEEFHKAHEIIPPEYFLFTYPTKNGHHIIIRPFNYNEYDIQIKKDELMYIG